MQIAWRAYRDTSRAMCPVLRLDHERRVRFEALRVPADRDVPVAPFESAVALISGRRWEAGSRLPLRVLRDEPVLLTLSRKDDYGRLRCFARPLERDPDYESAFLYQGDGSPIITPERVHTGVPTIQHHRAVSLGHGVFQIPPGLPEYRDIHVNGEGYQAFVEYDPQHGTLYLETPDGEPLSPDTEVDVWTSLSKSWRIPTGTLPAGRHVLTQDGLGEGPVVGHLIVEDNRQFSDARRLPRVSDHYTHRVDYAHYDGDPVATGHLYIIYTNLPKERIDEAVRQTLPAGSWYRIAPLDTDEDVPTLTGLTHQKDGTNVSFEWDFV